MLHYVYRILRSTFLLAVDVLYLRAIDSDSRALLRRRDSRVLFRYSDGRVLFGRSDSRVLLRRSDSRVVLRTCARAAARSLYYLMYACSGTEKLMQCNADISGRRRALGKGRSIW